MLDLFIIGGDATGGSIDTGGASALAIASYAAGTPLVITARPATPTGTLVPPCQRRVLSVAGTSAVYWRSPGGAHVAPVLYALDPPPGVTDGPVFGPSAQQLLGAQLVPGSADLRLDSAAFFADGPGLLRNGFAVHRIIGAHLEFDGVAALQDVVVSAQYAVGGSFYPISVPAPAQTADQLEVPGALALRLAVQNAGKVWASVAVGVA